MAKALEYGKLSIDYADDSDSTGEYRQIVSRTTYATALFHYGCADKFNEAKALFIDAEKRQQQYDKNTSILDSAKGYRYCQLLLRQSSNNLDEVITRANTCLAKRGYSILDIALHELTLAHVYYIKMQQTADITFEQQAVDYINVAVEDLRKAGMLEFLPKGLLTRAAIFSHTKNYQQAWQDLNEAYEIASFGGMKLHLCDYHLTACTVIEQQTGLKTVDDKETFTEHLAEAKALVNQTGYHLRDDEIKQLLNIL